VLSHWSARENTEKKTTDSSLKWILLDFFTEPGTTSSYSLVVCEGRNLPPQNPVAMLIQYLRLGDRTLLDVAEDMVRHRYDIDQWHTGDGKSGWQRYEKSWHGHKERVGAGTER